MRDATIEMIFQNNIIEDLKNAGWKIGNPNKYNRELALYEEDLLGFVKDTQEKMWDKYKTLYPENTEKKFLEKVASRLNKVDPNGATKDLRTYGTLGVLRNQIKDRGTRFSLCQFKPDHDLNPDTIDRYNKNRLTVIPELVYSPHATEEELEKTGKRAKKWRIDLVLFVNGLPIVTMELKSEFKQSIQNAIKQYKTTRFAIDPITKKVEPLLTFKRGALIHFAVSQNEVYMTSRLEGQNTSFLPFNRGTSDGGAGNDIPKDQNRYATDYLWKDVLSPDNLLNILHKFIHLQIEEKEDWEGRKYKKETMIFPRYHQWDVVKKLINSAKKEGAGQKYLIQHSAGSGKSNSIAWVSHQLSSLHKENGEKVFDSVIIVTDRTVLDDQLQDTIYQFEHTSGVVGRINRNEGQGSKSEKLAEALEKLQPIIIVTIQTFPHVLKAIEDSKVLKERAYAIIADEAHTSQTGSTAKKMKEVLANGEDCNKILTAEEILDLAVSSEKTLSNLSYLAFTATPKPKTLELFGRLPNPDEVPSKENKPKAFHVYSMREAIEEGFILDVLKNYTNYNVAYKLARSLDKSDEEVESKKAKVKINQWVRLHDHNISQKIRIIVEHFKNNVMGLLGGQAKAMVITNSRKEAVRYKQGFDKYIKEMGYNKIHAMVAFSGEVEFTDKDPVEKALIGEKFTENNMNPNLKGRDMRKAFDSEDYQVMIVANKFQTGFDQAKLCAMYVDKKLKGVDCVQTLSRLNRVFPGKKDCGTYVLDFFNESEEILEAFQEYYETAELSDVSDPDVVDDLFEKLQEPGIYLWSEVEQFCELFLKTKSSNAALINICRPAVERWTNKYKRAREKYKKSKDMFERAKKTKDAVLVGNSETDLKEVKLEYDGLDLFRKDLGTFVRYYDFMSQIVEFDNRDLEKLSLYAKNLRPLLRVDMIDEEDIDLEGLFLSHYRLSKIKQKSLELEKNIDSELKSGSATGASKAKDKKEELISKIISGLNDIYAGEDLTDEDKLKHFETKFAKLLENKDVLMQILNNTREQAMLGDFPRAVEDTIIESGEIHTRQDVMLLSDPDKLKAFTWLLLDKIKESLGNNNENSY